MILQDAAVDKYAHEAGFDAYMTGAVFVALADMYRLRRGGGDGGGAGGFWVRGQG